MSLRPLAFAWMLLAAAASAAAQSNSLFKSSRPQPHAAPTTQPASGAPVAPVAPAAPNSVRNIQNDPDVPPPPNLVLLQSSLIAVQVPKPRRFKVNDLITVIVREDKRSQSDAKIKSEKKWEVDSELKKWIRLDVHDHLVPQTFPNGTPAVQFNWDDKYNGEGKNERKDSLTTRITATIIDVKPNGTLVIEDIKTIKTDEDKQVLRLTGTCRSEDVTPENTVLSTQLAGAKIETENTGPSRDASKRGWLKQILDFVNPF
jgi:flagellar L-ring protein precursor FlgH